VLVLSDTHVPGRARRLPRPVYEALAQADAILHAGDLDSEDVLDELAAFAPVYAVAGNVDPPEVWRRLPRRLLVELAGYRVGLIHGDGADRRRAADLAAAAFPGADAVVFGHTHRPLLERRGNLLLFNPGSATDRRGEPRCSFGWLHLEDGFGRVLRAEHVFFDDDQASRAPSSPF